MESRFDKEQFLLSCYKDYSSRIDLSYEEFKAQVEKWVASGSDLIPRDSEDYLINLYKLCCLVVVETNNKNSQFNRTLNEPTPVLCKYGIVLPF